MSSRREEIHFVSLGCPKNRVDTEVMLGVARASRLRARRRRRRAPRSSSSTPAASSARRRRSRSTPSSRWRGYKEDGSCKRLVVAGCLSQRHPEELAPRDARGRSLPRLERHAQARPGARAATRSAMLVGNPADWLIRAGDPRTLSTRGGSAYVKIAEGCNRTCSFCVIPELRGKQRSRADRRRGARGRAARRGAASARSTSSRRTPSPTAATSRRGRRAPTLARARASASPTCPACAGCGSSTSTRRR